MQSVKISGFDHTRGQQEYDALGVDMDVFNQERDVIMSTYNNPPKLAKSMLETIGKQHKKLVKKSLENFHSKSHIIEAIYSGMNRKTVPLDQLASWTLIINSCWTYPRGSSADGFEALLRHAERA